MEKIIETIYEGILSGDQQLVTQQVTEALNSGLAPDLILKEGLVAAMDKVGKLFENGEYYVPEMLIAARAMQAGLNCSSQAWQLLTSKQPGGSSLEPCLAICTILARTWSA